MNDREFDADRAIKILNHPTRIKIIELLATKGPLSWKELSKEVGTSTGALYHHVDMLERIVERDSAKRFVLTGLGWKVHEYMKARSSTYDSAALGKLLGRGSASSALQALLIPRSLISVLTSSRRLAVASSVGMSLLVLVSMFASKSKILLLAFFPSQNLFQSATSLGGSVPVMIAIVWVGTRLTGTKADTFVLLSSVTLSLLPLSFFSLILRGLTDAGSLGILADRNALTLVFAIFQGWGACIVGAGVSVASGMRVEKAFLISLTIVYITFLAVFAQGLNFI